MTSLSWFSGSRESSRNCIVLPPGRAFLGLVGAVADDPGAFHLPDGGPVIHHGVMLRAAVIPDRDAVRLPAPAHLVFRDRRAADEIGEEIGAARREVLA